MTPTGLNLAVILVTIFPLKVSSAVTLDSSRVEILYYIPEVSTNSKVVIFLFLDSSSEIKRGLTSLENKN